MIKRIQGMIVGIIIGSMLAAGSLYAANTKTLQVTFNNIRIFVDGIQINPTNPSGDKIEPFIYNGTTYLPVRAVGEALGQKVYWDAVEQCVYIGARPNASR
ncbi:MAG: copper amine oxidase N-terminal domain-containing protein [Peptococcaceae bacterium]|jgi:hypothetical protein|nr:copper amine oxidase N-terminal domain-containing protein [Peptococcaceae bacterium]